MLVIKLAFKDLIFERLLSLCIVASIVAVISPLLLLFSLKFGVVTTLKENFKANPQNLEIKMLSGYKLEESFFNKLRDNPHISFIIPNTRSLSALVTVRFNGKLKQNVEIVPSAENDPLLIYGGFKGSFYEDSLVISNRLSNELGVHLNDFVEVLVTRKINGINEAKKIKMQVIGILERSISNNYQIFMSLDNLSAIEDYKDGFDPNFVGEGSNLNLNRRYYAKARIYAKTIDDVEPLSIILRESYNISDKLPEIENIRAIDGVLRFIFLVIALTSIVGGILAFWGLIISNCRRKTKSYAMLRLGGFSRKMIMQIILFENTVLVMSAYLVSLLLFYIGQNILKSYFIKLLKQEVIISLLQWQHIITGLFMALFITIILSLICGYTVTKNQDFAQDLREV
ncbi:MAG: ABC transporter permease [Succinivibrionaceae bacterium]